MPTAQAINVWNGLGPYKIVNNYLEATGEDFMSGGTDPAITYLTDPADFPDANTGAVPSDIEFVGNYCTKRLSWMPIDPSYAGIRWTIKNSFELKNAERVLIDGNIFENVMQNDQGQSATGIVFTVRDQSGTAPWSILSDITFTNNIVRHVGVGMRITGEDDLQPSQQTQRILIENNAFYDLNTAYCSTTDGLGLSTPTGGYPILDLVYRHNLILHTDAGSIMIGLGSPDHVTEVVQDFVCDDNIMTLADYGVFGNGGTSGSSAINNYVATYSFQGNVAISRSVDRQHAYDLADFATVYPANNSIADETSTVGFTDFDNADYRLTDQSAYHDAATDGKDPGPDWNTLEAATAGTISGVTTAPTVATTAAATPNPVDGTTTNLLVLGADDGGEANLTYTWVASSKPTGASDPIYSVNDSNAAKNTTATFFQAGEYTFRVTIEDADGLDVTSSVDVTVNQTLTNIVVSPSTLTLNFNQTQQFTAIGYDQFGVALATPPTITWGTTAGTIDDAGLYTAPAAIGSAVITATSGSVVGSAAVTISNAVPTVYAPASAALSPVTATMTDLSVLGADDGGEANLTYTWAAINRPNGAVDPTYTVNSSNAAKNTTATFFQAGSYTFQVTIADAGGLSTTSTVTVLVNQTLTSITVSPATATLNFDQTQQFTAIGYDQFWVALATPPTITWGTTAGTIDDAGLYTPAATAESAVISARAARSAAVPRLRSSTSLSRLS